MKRMLSMLLACSMTLGVMGFVPVAAEDAAADSGYVKGDIDVFYSFSDYDGTSLPNGFMKIDSVRANRALTGETYSDTTRTSKVFKVSTAAEPVIPFNTNFVDGKMHISFDYMQKSDVADKNTGRILNLMFARNTSNPASKAGYGDVNSKEVVAAIGNDSETTWNQNEYDYTKLVAGQGMNILNVGSGESNIPMSVYSGNQKLVGVSDTNGTSKEGASITANTWNKIDIFVDKDTGEYELYLNGNKQEYGFKQGTSGIEETTLKPALTQANGFNALKGLIFRSDHLCALDGGRANTDNDQGSFYLDNVYVSAYDANTCTDDVLKITADTLGEVMKKDSKLNIGFSEWLKEVPTKENFTITDKNGNEFTDFTVSADNAQATITFNGNLSSGVYTVAVNGVKGAVSGSDVTNAVEFTAASSTAADSTRYYYADEDFESFEEGVVLPNWYYGGISTGMKDGYNRYYMTELDSSQKYAVEKTDGAVEESTAIKMKESTNSNNMYYYFPRGIASGEFSVEFDVKHKNGGWSFGFVNYEDYNTLYNRATYGRLKSNTGNVNNAPAIEGIGQSWQMQYKILSSVLLGMADENYSISGVDDIATTPYLGMFDSEQTYNSDVDNYRNYLRTVKGTNEENLKIEPQTWSKVEINVNDNTKEYTVTVTPYTNGVLDESKAQTATWNDTDKNKYFKGIMGIRLQQKGEVCFDNIKVYKEATSYLDEDFDDYSATETGTDDKILPSGWTTYNADTWREFHYRSAAKTAKGVTAASHDTQTALTTDTGATTDKAMFMYYSNPVVYKSFEKPVPAGEPFVMEFDVYDKESGVTGSWGLNEIEWMFMQMGKDDTQQLLGYNYPGGISPTGKVYVAPADTVAYNAGYDDLTNVTEADGLINDTKLAQYKPYAKTDDAESEPTVDDTYVRINGNYMRMNALFGTAIGGKNFIYSASGRKDPYRAFHNQDTTKVVADDNNDLTYLPNEWANYKILCEPISASQTKYTITQKAADGTTRTATFTNSRDWFTQDTYAIGFAIPKKNASKNNTSDGTIGTLIDNVKVYAADVSGNAIENVSENYITSIVAKNADASKEKEILGAESVLPEGTKSIDITFSAPIKEKINPQLPAKDTTLPEVCANKITATLKGTYTSYVGDNDDFTDYTSILDSIKDVVSLRRSNSQIPAYTSISLSEDKKTVTLTFGKAMSDGEKYSLGINQNIAFDGDGYARLSGNFVKTYTVSGGFDGEGYSCANINATVFRGTADVPVDKAGPLKAGEEIKVTLDGVNTTSDATTAFIGYAFYAKNESGVSMLKEIKTETKTLDVGADFTNVDAGYNLTVPEDCDYFKAFAWDYPSMMPYGNMMKAEITFQQ